MRRYETVSTYDCGKIADLIEEEGDGWYIRMLVLVVNNEETQELGVFRKDYLL